MNRLSSYAQLLLSCFPDAVVTLLHDVWGLPDADIWASSSSYEQKGTYKGSEEVPRISREPVSGSLEPESCRLGS